MIDFLASIPAGAWAVIGSVFGGVGLKSMEWRLNRAEVRREDRKDYRAEIHELQTRLDKEEDEVDTWKGKYWQSQEEVARLRQTLIKSNIEVPK